jgi:hypothetical protein
VPPAAVNRELEASPALSPAPALLEQERTVISSTKTRPSDQDRSGASDGRFADAQDGVQVDITYREYSIEAVETSPGRWRAYISRMDGYNIKAYTGQITDQIPPPEGWKNFRLKRLSLPQRNSSTTAK